MLVKISLTDEMDVKENLLLMFNAGKQRKRKDKYGKFSQESFLEYENKFFG